MTRPEKLQPYIVLIEQFLSDAIDSSAFEKQYLHLFKSDETLWTDENYDVLNEMFLDVDAFCPDEALRDPGDLDENQLRARAQVTLDKLRTLY